MKKKSAILIILTIILLAAANTLYLSNNKPKETIKTLFTGDMLEKVPDNMKNVDISVYIFLAQWIIVIIIISIYYIRYLSHKKRERKKINYMQKKIEKKESQTDLDILYHLLLTQKSLSIKAIAKYFKITKDRALDWAKILERSELIRIDYPMFGEPEIIIQEKKTDKEQDEKNTEKTIDTRKNKVKKQKTQKRDKKTKEDEKTIYTRKDKAKKQKEKKKKTEKKYKTKKSKKTKKKTTTTRKKKGDKKEKKRTNKKKR